MSNQADLKLPDDFSLVQGGPLFQLFVRSRLSTSALDWLGRRIVTFSLLTWLPLLRAVLGSDSIILITSHF